MMSMETGGSANSNKFPKRPAWDEFWFTIALFYGSRGTCDRLRTACLIVDANNRLLGSGYNGSLPGEPHCDEAGHFMVDGHCLRTLHAEDNAILHSHGNLEGSTAYILDTPCVACAKKLISKGVRRILYTREFANIGGGNEGVKFIHEIAARKGVEIRKVGMRFYETIGNILAITRGTGGRLAGEAVPEEFFLNHGQNQNFSGTLAREKETLPLRVEKVSPFAKLPLRVYDDDAGYDLFSAEDTLIMPSARATVGTGLKFAVPRGYAGFIWDKSGIAARHGVKTLGGVLDSNYRGELKVILANLGENPYEVRRGEKIAQLVIKPVARPPLVETRIEETTERGAGGFGSTGLL